MIMFNQAVARHPALWGSATTVAPLGIRPRRRAGLTEEIVVIEGPLTEALENGFPPHVESALKSASVVIAQGTASLLLFEQWWVGERETRRAGMGILPGEATVQWRDTAEVENIQVIGARQLHYLPDKSLVRSGLARPPRLTMAEFGSYVPRPSRQRPDRRQSVIATGGTPHGGFHTEAGLRLLEAAALLAKPGFSPSKRVRLCSINVAKGDETLVELQLSGAAACSRQLTDAVFARVARPYAEELDLTRMILETDILLLNGGVSTSRVALLEHHGMNGPIDSAVEKGAVALAFSDGVARMAEKCIGGVDAPSVSEGGGHIKGGVVLHTEDPRRYALMINGVRDGVLPSPTYGIPTEVFVHFVDGIPLEAHATSKLAADRARQRWGGVKLGRNYNAPVRIERRDGAVTETPLCVEPFSPIFYWKRTYQSFLDDPTNARAFADALEQFESSVPYFSSRYGDSGTRAFEFSSLPGF